MLQKKFHDRCYACYMRDSFSFRHQVNEGQEVRPCSFSARRFFSSLTSATNSDYFRTFLGTNFFPY